MYVITYLNSVVLGYGLFESLEAVEKWKETYLSLDPNRKFYEGKLIPKNRANHQTMFLPDGVDFKYSNPR